MNVDELLKVSEGLSWVAEQLRELPDVKSEVESEVKLNAVLASGQCSIAQLIVTELVVHLSQGLKLSEALQRTAVGALSLDGSVGALSAEPKE